MLTSKKKIKVDNLAAVLFVGSNNIKKGLMKTHELLYEYEVELYTLGSPLGIFGAVKHVFFGV